MADDTTVDAPAPVVLGMVPAGGHRLKVRALAQEDASAPVVVVLPAMGVPARYYRAFVGQLHQRGLTAVTFDLRGQGESTPVAARRVRYGYQHLVDDLGDVLGLVESFYPRAPRYLLGHSLGGQVAMLHAARYPHRVRGVVLVAAGSVWFRGFPRARRAAVLAATQLVAGVSAVLGFWPGHRFGFGGRQAGPLMRDWARNARTGRYALAGSSYNYEAALSRLRLPLLTVSVADDWLAPPTSVDHLVGKAPRAPRTHRHYTSEQAGPGDLGHFAWTRRSGELARWIGEWVGGSADRVGRLGHRQAE
ncbi:alpha/beta hydrolase family protein [Saccharopolyspora cebuensis]|uniref:Alpha/beta fold hydrolase n=1 Tax=Saccharopolyspora cebuensis TaxID=418759 RepID=A0ABV4CKK0_9PSEU